jgi:hypothetical protein
MDWGIREIGGLVLNLLGSVSPVAALIGLVVLLNRRDRRQARLLSSAARQFSGEVLRSDIVIDARCALLTKRAEVRVDIAHDGGEVWPAIERLRQTLPPMVALAVRGAARPDPTGNVRGGATSAGVRAGLALPMRVADREVRVKPEVAVGHVSQSRV